MEKNTINIKDKIGLFHKKSLKFTNALLISSCLLLTSSAYAMEREIEEDNAERKSSTSAKPFEKKSTSESLSPSSEFRGSERTANEYFTEAWELIEEKSKVKEGKRFLKIAIQKNHVYAAYYMSTLYNSEDSESRKKHQKYLKKASALGSEDALKELSRIRTMNTAKFDQSQKSYQENFNNTDENIEASSLKKLENKTKAIINLSNDLPQLFDSAINFTNKYGWIQASKWFRYAKVGTEGINGISKVVAASANFFQTGEKLKNSIDMFVGLDKVKNFYSQIYPNTPQEGKK